MLVVCIMRGRDEEMKKYTAQHSTAQHNEGEARRVGVMCDEDGGGGGGGGGRVVG